MVVTYIEHSGFSVELPECTLLFDYYLGKLPEFPKEHPLIVFASHVHGESFPEKDLSVAGTVSGSIFCLIG